MNPQAGDEIVSRLVKVARRDLSGESSRRDDLIVRRLEQHYLGWHGTRLEPRWRWAGAFAAASCAAVLAVFLLIRTLPLSYEVVNGRSVSGYIVGGVGTRIDFSDGSTVTLEPLAETQVEELGDRGGTVNLRQGSVRVAIAKAPGADWSVRAGPYVVRVTGTAFDVRWTEATRQFELMLYSGSVSVRGPFSEGPVALSAGQRLVSQPSGEKGTITAEIAKTPPLVDAQAVRSAPESPADAEIDRAFAGGAHPNGVPPEQQTAVPSKLSPNGASGSDELRWSQKVANGRFHEVLAEAERRGLAQTIGRARSEDLAALADAARYARRVDLARQVLLAQRQRFAGSARAREAAFHLGRLAEGSKSSAMEWYDRYLSESPRGPFAAQALGRKMMLLHEHRGPAAARPIANEYLKRYPSGDYSAAASKIAVEPSP